MLDIPIDLQARVRLAHAVVARIARDAEVDGLMVKGPALDPSLSTRVRGTDVDIWVRPRHLDRFIRALRAHGWALVTDFEYGSAFGHASNYWHSHFGYLDLHRSFPGITLSDDRAFDLLWEQRTEISIAHQPCLAPSVLDQRVLLCLHAARSGGHAGVDEDLEGAWVAVDEETRAQIVARTHQLRARVALAAAIGDLDDFADDRSAALWRHYRDGGSRTAEWRARFKAARGLRGKTRVLRQLLSVNTQFEEMLGGGVALRRRDVAAIAVRRARTALGELVGRRNHQGRDTEARDTEGRPR